MLEVMRYLRDSGYKTYSVTGGGQDFVRVYAERVYGIPPEQVVGSAGATKLGYQKDGEEFLTKEPKLLLNDDHAGKPEGTVLTPIAAFAEPGPMQGACMSDVKSLCGSIQPGGGRIRDCMKEHRAQLSNRCKIAIAARMLERRPNQSGAAPAAAAKPED